MARGDSVSGRRAHRLAGMTENASSAQSVNSTSVNAM